jgi:TFIIF-interacting CTD phosphatase-like protein
LIRPGTENFLEEMSKYFEIVVFTAAMQDVNLNKILSIQNILIYLVCRLDIR